MPETTYIAASHAGPAVEVRAAAVASCCTAATALMTLHCSCQHTPTHREDPAPVMIHTQATKHTCSPITVHTLHRSYTGTRSNGAPATHSIISSSETQHSCIHLCPKAPRNSCGSTAPRIFCSLGELAMGAACPWSAGWWLTEGHQQPAVGFTRFTCSQQQHGRYVSDCGCCEELQCQTEHASYISSSVMQ
jgi:hypothetical protein